MGFFNKKKEAGASTPLPIEKGTPTDTPSTHTPYEQTPATRSLASVNELHDTANTTQALEQQPVTFFALLLGAIASIGGFIFGYESGQISGPFHHPYFSHSHLTTSRFPRHVRFPRPLRRKRKVFCGAARHDCWSAVHWDLDWMFSLGLDLR
jgi:hypothetical protein